VAVFAAVLVTIWLLTGSLNEREMGPMALFWFCTTLSLVLSLALWLERGCRFALSGVRHLLILSAFLGVPYVAGGMFGCLIALVRHGGRTVVIIRDMAWIATLAGAWLALAFLGARRTRQGLLAFVASSKSAEREGREEHQQERLYRALYLRGWGVAAIARRLRIPITAVATLAWMHESKAYGPLASVFDRPLHARPPVAPAEEPRLGVHVVGRSGRRKEA